MSFPPATCIRLDGPFEQPLPNTVQKRVFTFRPGEPQTAAALSDEDSKIQTSGQAQAQGLYDFFFEQKFLGMGRFLLLLFYNEEAVDFCLTSWRLDGAGSGKLLADPAPGAW